MIALPLDGLALILVIPAVSAALLVALPGYVITSKLNVLASFLTLVAALSLLWRRPEPGLLLHVDDLNVVFIVLNTFVGFTTSAFSASYIAHEIETGRLTPTYLRFYYAMYQAPIFEMNLALVANNLGLMWVGVEFATLTTVLMVGIYRTHEALEVAWKYFILGSVGIALALFGTILLYLAAKPMPGMEIEAMAWTKLMPRADTFDPGLLNLAFVFLLLGYGTKVGLAPMHGWLSEPILAILLVIGIILALGALLQKLNTLAFGAPKGGLAPVEASYVPMFSHFALILAAGVFLPTELVAWFQNVARLLGG